VATITNTTIGLSPIFRQELAAAQQRIASAAADVEALDAKMAKISRNKEVLELQNIDPHVEMSKARKARDDAEAQRQRGKHEITAIFQRERERWITARQAEWVKNAETLQKFKDGLIELSALIDRVSDFAKNGAASLGEEGEAIDRWGEEFGAAVVEHKQPYQLVVQKGEKLAEMIVSVLQAAVRDSKIFHSTEALRRIVNVPLPPPPATVDSITLRRPDDPFFWRRF
jgi:hypothetical protein